MKDSINVIVLVVVVCAMFFLGTRVGLHMGAKGVGGAGEEEIAQARLEGVASGRQFQAGTIAKARAAGFRAAQEVAAERSLGYFHLCHVHGVVEWEWLDLQRFLYEQTKGARAELTNPLFTPSSIAIYNLPEKGYLQECPINLTP